MTRPETGPMQFAEDWPGVFIRGDHALYFAMALRTVLERVSEPGFDVAALEGLRTTLAGCYARTAMQVQRARMDHE